MLYNNRQIGIIISRMRTEKGMTQEQLAGLAGISRSHLALVESGRKVLRLDTLWKIAEGLGTEAWRILKEGD